MTRAAALVTDDQIEAYARDGAVCLKGLFETHWLESLAAGLEANFADPGPDGTHYTPEGAPGAFYDDYCNWQRIPQYRDFVLNSPAGEIAGRLMRARASRIYHEHVLVKEPGTEQVTPWHHDLPYYGVDGDQLCSIWLPLDPVPQAACPEFVAGSHRSYADGIPGYETIPDIEAERDSLNILSWPLDPGDCIVFHMRTVHGAPATTEMKGRRRGFSTRWMGDDARFAERVWQTSPPFREVDLAPGAPMDHPSFPIVWQA
jgi:ectoine hydroxylase-related dioxygenase (phytanoyl-CoA dioxygenase family)